MEIKVIYESSQSLFESRLKEQLEIKYPTEIHYSKEKGFSALLIYKESKHGRKATRGRVQKKDNSRDKGE